MTSHFASKVSGTLLALAIVSTSFAQKVKTLPPVTVQSTAPLGAISTRIGKCFSKDFKDAVGATWYKLNKDYLVTFISRDMKNDALYQKNGLKIYSIGYGREKNLPGDVRATVKSQYYDYDIISVLKLNQEDREMWIVNMKGNKKLLITSVEDGVMNVMHNYEVSQ